MKIKIQRLYAWSIILEPMIYFTVCHQRLSGVGLNISRMMQIVILLFFIRLAISGKINLRISGVIKSRYSLFVLYFCLAVMSGIVGLLMGVYSLDAVINLPRNSFISGIIRSSYFRPFFEYIILAYYIGYFAVLPSIILKKEEDIKYLFKVFFLIFNISLIIGLIDCFLVWKFRITITGRHLHEWYTEPNGPLWVGLRFHGIFGEPRDAFVLLGFGAAFYYLKAIFFNEAQYKWYYALLLICAVMTKSTSGIMGVIIFIMLYFVTICIDFRLRRFIKAFILFSVLGVVFYVAIVTSNRLGIYLDFFTGGIKVAYYEGEVPTIIYGQMVNIYPIFWIIENLVQFNPIPLLIGQGLGSSVFVSGSYGMEGLSNPHAGIIRVIAGTGIIGCFLYVSAFYIPVKRMTRKLPYKIRDNIILFMILVLSLTLGHRSPAGFIFIGVLFAIFNVFANNGILYRKP